MPLNFNDLTTTTFKNYRKKYADLITDKIGLYKYLKEKKHVERRKGGLKIVEPLMYAENSTFGSYSGYDTLDTTPQKGLSAAEYDWKNCAVAITISEEELDTNKGKSKILSLFKSKVEQSKKTFINRMEKMLFADGTGNNAKDFAGLQSYMTAAPSSVGGIDGTANAWWDNQRETITAFDTDGLAKMRSLFNKCSREGDSIDIMITDRITFEAYEALLTPIERINYSKNKSLAGDMGFETLLFKGRPFLWSNAAPAKKMFFLNSDYLKLVIDPDKDHHMTKWRVPLNQMAKTAFILLRGNLVCNNRQMLGLASITNYT